MKLLPYDKFEIQTTLTLEETITALKAQVEPKKWLRWFSRDHAIFEGDVSRDGFKIMRIIHYRNSFMPVIRGTFKQGQNGINVTIRMGLHPFVMAFMCVWFGGVTVGLFAVGAGLSNANISLSPPLLIPIAMLIFGWVMVSGGFWFEASKAKPQLLSILHGQIKSEQIARPDTG
jgi:hypothetical protein